MINKSKTKKILFLSMIVGLFLLSTFAQGNQETGSNNNPLSESIAQKEEELRQIKTQIEAYKGQIEAKKSESRTIQSQMAILDDEIFKLSLEVQKTQMEISQLNQVINSKENQIEQKEKEIIAKKDLLKEYLVIIYEYDNVSILEMMLREEKFSDLFAEISAVEGIQNELHDTLLTIKKIKEDLEVQKEVLEDQKDEQGELLAMQEAQKTFFANQQFVKQKLLAKVKKEQASILALVKENEQDMAVIQVQLYQLQSLGNPISYADAKSAAEFASLITGVRQSYLLGILKVESNLGTNVGGGRYRTDMNPSQLEAFKEITSSLGLDPETMPVSKKPSSYRGWGGAMGPAQMMPNTWMVYKDRVSELTGRIPANPWNLQDALVAMALKVSQIPGVAEANYQAEYEAAGRYFAGSRWQKFSWYADAVMEYAKEYEIL